MTCSVQKLNKMNLELQINNNLTYFHIIGLPNMVSAHFKIVILYAAYSKL